MSQLRVSSVTDLSGAGSTYAPGHVVQVVSVAKTDTFTTSTVGFTPITGLSATITPTSASSKILVLVQVSYGMGSSSNYPGFRLFGGNAGVYVGNADGAKTSSVFGGYNEANNGIVLNSSSINFLTSPNSTSPQTIGVEVYLTAGTVFINRASNEAFNNADRHRGASSITLMEIAQ
jgi:hypothetical protein